jgi:glycosyltransferase involved in cell wall biosynthesis
MTPAPPRADFVSVLMVVHEPSAVYFAEAVGSVLTQTHEALELVVIEKPSALSAEALLCGHVDPRIRYSCLPATASRSDQRNEGLRQARGELVAVMDADDVCHPHRLGAQVEFLRRNPEVAVLGSQLEIIGSHGEWIAWRRYPCEHEAIVSAMPRYDPIAHPSVMLRRDVVLSGGGYECCTTADYMLWSRLARAGARFANHPETLLKYRIHPLSSKSRQVRETLRGTLATKRRYWRDRLGWRGWLRMTAERAMLLLPPQLVLNLFYRTQFRSGRP